MNILIVDDSKAMRAIVMRAVKAAGFADATYREAGNGVEALAAIRAQLPDLVLTDWNMPEMSGFELIKAVRAEGHPLKIGMVTSESDPALCEQARAAGALFLLAKPFSPEAVKALLLPVLS
ncbi:MAG TPA: response regulator [Anaeromyxobacteraceae bacterium]|nr:response regulator [Anaeromyxobacteraceae bacterium]